MSTETEGKFQVSGASLYTKTWTPTETIKAKLLFVHGFNEHINRYNDFFPRLAAQGIQVLGWDQRGWGRSVTKPSDRGATGATPLVIADLAAFVKQHLPSDVPVFVMGHSMGGGEILILAGDKQYEGLVSQIRGWILEGPFIGFTAEEEPSAFKVAVGRFVGKILPKQQMKHIVPPEHLSRDPAVVEAIKTDPLCHNTGTLEGLAGLLDRAATLSAGTVKLGRHVRSVWLAHGVGDKTCSHDKAMSWMDGQPAIEDKEKKSYEAAYHQLHADLCKDEFGKDLVEWLLKRCDGGAAATTTTTTTSASTAVEAKL